MMIVRGASIAVSQARPRRSWNSPSTKWDTAVQRPDDDVRSAGQDRRPTERQARGIPTGWDVVHRPDDGEPVGYLAPAPGDGGLVVPTTLAGTPAGRPG